MFRVFQKLSKIDFTGVHKANSLILANLSIFFIGKNYEKILKD